MRGRGRWVLKGAAFVVVVLALVALLSLVVMSLWNALIPSLFGGPALRFWQAAGLLVLSRILFGGFRGRGGHWHNKWHHKRMWHRHWEQMTPEERARLREKLRHRCGWGEEEEAPEPPKPSV